MIHSQCRSGHHVLVVHIGRDADNAPGRGAHLDELHHRIGPHHVPVDRILIREHPLRQALAHDDDLLAAAAIGFVEIASGDDRDAECRKKTGRDGPQLRPRIFFTRPPDMAVRGEIKSGTKSARVAPRNDGAHGDMVHTRQLCDAPYGFLVEAGDLIERSAASQ